VIFVLECPEGTSPHCWFAFDADDLRAKIAANGGPPGHPMHLWPDEASAVMAFENEADPLWQGGGWRRRAALHEQLLATEVIAEG